MARSGRLTLVTSVLTAIMTYFLTVFDPPKWLIKKIERIRRNFLWCGEDIASGAKCLVNWKQVCSPKQYGGMGVKDLALFSKALRLRWLWLNWQDPDRPWHGLPLPINLEDMPLFQACTSIQVGNGKKPCFGKTPGTLALPFTSVSLSSSSWPSEKASLFMKPCTMEDG